MHENIKKYYVYLSLISINIFNGASQIRLEFHTNKTNFKFWYGLCSILSLTEKGKFWYRKRISLLYYSTSNCKLE